MPKTSPNKSAFIRSLPADMPAADVVAKAKAANLKLTPAFVYAIRSKSRNKARGGAKKGTRKAAGGAPSASDFVRTQPSSMKAAEVVSAGAKRGIKFSTNLVYAVRSSSNRKGGGGGRARRGGRAAASTNHAGSEASFRRLALDLGIGKARNMLEDLESRLRQLIGG